MVILVVKSTKMDTRATTIEEQIQKLNSYGMIFDNESEIAKLKEILLDIGYYRLSFYLHFFQDPHTRMFFSGVKLRHILQLYYFDFDLKILLLRYIYRIEVHFRTQFIHLASNKFAENNAWYMDAKNMDSHIFKDFNGIYFNLKTKNKIIIEHHKKHTCDFAPAWKVFEFLTFGQTFKFFSNLKNENLKKEVSGIYGFREVNLLNNYLIALINIRNICSHNGLLFDFNQPYGIRRIPNKRYRIKNRNTTNINASIRLILFIK